MTLDDMTPDDILHQQSCAVFLTEAQDILRRIEQDLLSLRDDRSPAKIHQLMRSAHTLKGAAASVGFDTIKQIAHVLEDIFKAFYNPDIILTAEVESLLFQAYECLRLPIMAAVAGQQIEEQAFLNRVALIIAQLQEQLGDCFDREAAIPNSAALGFDVVQSLFEVGVQQRLQELKQAIDSGNSETVSIELQTKADILLGLAESLNLPGFAAIAQTALTAAATHPSHIIEIAQLALHDFVQGRTQVLAGDRTQGGTTSAELQALAHPQRSQPSPEITAPSLESESTAAFNSLDSSASQSQSATPFNPSASLSLDDIFGNINTAWNETDLNTENRIESNKKLEQKIEPEKPTSHIASPKIAPPTTLTPETKPIYTAVTTTEASEPQAETHRSEPVRVNLEQLKHLDYLAGELLINQSQQTTQDQQLRSTLQELRSSLSQHQQTLYQLQDYVERLTAQVEQVHLPLPTLSLVTAAVPSISSFDDLELEHYNDLRLFVRSAINQTIQLDQTAETVEQTAKQSRRTLGTQHRLLKQVRDDLTALRMRPLRDLLNRFPRLLQQLAEVHAKPVELILSGTQVLVDKRISEQLYDPLLHLIRNAFDHGIESPQTRQVQGKPAISKIEIRATQQGNQTVIEVKDDGQGINLTQVAQRAIELNLISREQVNTMPESQLLDLIFRPGFSTATELSDLSGRGIGLDVVNSQLQALNGSIAVTTAPQQGTTFCLKIPLSLTTTKLLVCQAQGYTYALPIEHIAQILASTSNQLHLSGQQPVLRWQHNQEEFLVPVYTLSELVSYSHTSDRLSSAANFQTPFTLHSKAAPASPLLLLQTIYGYRALLVDQVLGEQELVIRSLNSTITPLPYVYGYCTLGNSRSILAIDIEVLMQLTTEVELPSELSSTSNLTSLLDRLQSTSVNALPPRSTQIDSFKPIHSGIILVVDDSLTLRQQLSQIFKQVGYAVLQAGDGQEALCQLRQQPNINAIICDIEMPNLNGFEFLAQVQRDPTLSKTPVVVLTSRSSPKHRQIALELGAVAYFTKPYHSNQLITTIDRLLKQPATL